jgi:hypothetical protein
MIESFFRILLNVLPEFSRLSENGRELGLRYIIISELFCNGLEWGDWITDKGHVQDQLRFVNFIFLATKCCSWRVTFRLWKAVLRLRRKKWIPTLLEPSMGFSNTELC